MENKLNLVIAKLNEIKTDYFEDTLEKLNNIKKQTGNFSYTDLKLHNVSYRLYRIVQDGIMSNEQFNGLFNHICECEYEYFEEWEEENIPSIERVYIGRTSSFYYLPKTWRESIIGSGTVLDLLKNNSILDSEIFGELEVGLYDFLLNKIDSIERYAYEVIETIHNQLEENHSIDEFKDELDTLFEDEISLLEVISSELDELQDIVNECQKAYDYLQEYKTEENELAMLEHYLDCEIENYISTDLADKIYEQILDEHTPLNKLTELHVYIAESDDENETFTITAESNLLATTYKTNVKRSNDRATYLIAFTLGHIRKQIEKDFTF